MWAGTGCTQPAAKTATAANAKPAHTGEVQLKTVKPEADEMVLSPVSAPLEIVLPEKERPYTGPIETVQPEADASETVPSDSVQPLRRGGSYRSPPRSYNPGAGTPTRTTPARPGSPTTAPDTRPNVPRTGFGGFFGGLALGTILGGLFNPFAGFALGYPFLSLISIFLWVAGIFALFRLFKGRNRY
jgi:hypothetical protein